MSSTSARRILRTALVLFLLAMATGAAAAQQSGSQDAASVPGNVAAQRKYADQLFDQGKDDDAKVVYARIASYYAKDFEFNMRLAYCYFVSKKNEMARAAVYFGRAHALRPQNAEAEMSLAKSLSWSKQYEPAIKLLNTIVKRDPANREAWLQLARAQNYNKEIENASATYRTYLQKWPDDVQVRVEFADWLSWNKHFDESLENYRVALTKQPHNANLLAGEAQVLAWKGELQQALETYDQALARSPNLFAALRGKAFALLWLEKYEDAARLFSKLHARRPGDPEVNKAIQTIATWRATEPERRKQAELAMFLKPAEAAMDRKDYPTAVEQFKEALDRAPGDKGIRFRLGDAYLWDRHWDDAIAVFGSLKTDYPDDINIVRELGHAYVGARKFADAVTLYESFLQRTTDPSLGVELARVLSWSGQLDRSITEYEAVLRQQPDNFDASLGLAQVHAWQGKSAEAVAEFDQLLARRPDSREAQLGHAQVLSWSGHANDALPLLEAMLKEHPDDREIANVLESVRDSLRQQEEQKRLAAAGPEPLQDRIRQDEAALLTHPDDVQLLERIADGYAELARYKDAIAYYDKALAVQPGNAELLLRIARVTSWNRDYAHSIDYYRQLLAREDKPESRVELAQVLSWSGRNRESIAEYHSILDRSADDIPVRLGLARVLSWDKQNDEALAEYNRVLQKDPQNRTALFERARLYAWMGEYATALQMYDSLLSSSPSEHDILLAKAQALNWSGHPRDAQQVIDKIEKTHAADRDVTLAKAAVQSSLGRRDVALRLLDSLDKLQPGNHDVESLRESIRNDVRPALVLGFTPSFDNGGTNIFASTATFYFSPQPQVRSYVAVSMIPSSVPTAFDRETGREFLFGSYSRLNQWLQVRGEFGASAASAGHVSPIGSAGATFFATDKMTFDFDFSRRFLNYLPQPITLDINRLQYRAAWNWRATPRTAIHVDYYHENYSDSNRNNGGNISVTEQLLKKEHVELEAGYLYAISAFDHQGNSGYFTPTWFQRHAALGNTRIIVTQRTGFSFWGSLGSEQVFSQGFRLDGTARATWDFKIRANLKSSLGYGYFAVSSAAGSGAYITHTAYSTLQYVF